MAQDLRGSAMDKQITRYLEKFTHGNESEVTTEKLERDRDTIRFKYLMRSRHNTGGPLPVIVYDVTLTAKGKFALRDPKLDDIEFCFDWPANLGSFCISAQKIAEIIMAVA
jgi:hypothetical protein